MQGNAHAVDEPFPPGARRGRGIAHPKGRQVDPMALEQVRSILGHRPRRRDLLIEHLHLIQDRHHALSSSHLAALASEMRLSMAEVYEVASFYAHFDLVDEDETAPPPLAARATSDRPPAVAARPAVSVSTAVFAVHDAHGRMRDSLRNRWEDYGCAR